MEHRNREIRDIVGGLCFSKREKFKNAARKWLADCTSGGAFGRESIPFEWRYRQREYVSGSKSDLVGGN